MKRTLIVTLALLLVFGFTACDGGSSNNGKVEISAYEPLKIGFIYIGAIDDGGFTQAHNNGKIAVEQHFGSRIQTMIAEEIDDQNTYDIRDAAEKMIEAGCKVIFGCSFGYISTMEELAGEYPGVIFLHFSGDRMNDTNFGNYFGAMEEPRYLAGIAAGMMTETNKIGYVAAYDYIEVQIGINAFALGAQSVNPYAEVNVVYINIWNDPEKEQAAAATLLNIGCDVLGQHCDTAAPMIAAEEAGAFAIGYNLDEPDSAPGAYLTAPIWNHGVYYIDVIQQILDGTFIPESFYGSMRDGYVDLAPLTDLVSNEAAAKVRDAWAKIIAGVLEPFSGEIYFADNTKLCEEGQTLTRDEIWGITQVIRGVKIIEY